VDHRLHDECCGGERAYAGDTICSTRVSLFVTGNSLAAVFFRTVALRAVFLALSARSRLLAQTTLREHLDATRIRAGRDSFVVMMQGKPAGWQRLTGSRDGSG